MRRVNKNKVFVQYKNVYPKYPENNRRYKVSIYENEIVHLLVYESVKGESFENSKFYEFQWFKEKDRDSLKSEIWMDIRDFNNPKKFEVIKNKITISLESIRYGDRFLFLNAPDLDDSPIIIKFNFNNQKFSKSYDFGKVGNYKI